MEHPIESLMHITMDSIKDMIDVNTIIGDPIQMNNNTAIIPISKVSFGFASGGSEFKGETIDEYNKRDKDEQIQYRLPFGGGAGAGVTINPVAFLVLQSGQVKLINVEHENSIDKILDYVPDLLEKMNKMFEKKLDVQKLQTDRIINHFKQRCNEDQKGKHKKDEAENENQKNSQNSSEESSNTENEDYIKTKKVEFETEIIEEEE